MENNEKITQITPEQKASEKIVSFPGSQKEEGLPKDLEGVLKEATEKNMHPLSGDEIDAILDMAEKSTPEEVKNMRESIIDTSEVEAEGGKDGYCEEIKNVGVDSSYADLLGVDQDQLPTSSNDIFDVASPTFKPNDEDVKSNIIKNSGEVFDLTDQESLEFADLLMRYRNKEEIPGIFTKLPKKIRDVIANMAAQQGVVPTEYNSVTKLFLDEFVSNAELDEVFVDLEKSLDEALKIPSIMDMYSEHTKSVMEERIPAIIEKIKDKEPQNAETLRQIQAAFKKSYELSFLKEFYKADHRTRSDMREHSDNPFSYCEQFNLLNAKSRFKMPDCMAICPALSKVLIKDSEDSTVQEGSRPDTMGITAEDVSKFIILFCRSFKFFDANDLVQAAQMYYSAKNIVILGRSAEAKTDFALELINNICDIIEFIREQEANYASRNRKRKKRNRK